MFYLEISEFYSFLFTLCFTFFLSLSTRYQDCEGLTTNLKLGGHEKCAYHESHGSVDEEDYQDHAGHEDSQAGEQLR